jgi:DNA-binding cell septation regulator SpoVG
VFHAGLMAGYRLTGFALWQAEGKSESFIGVTVPSRKVAGGRFYEFLRTVSGDIKDMDRIKGAIVKEYRAVLEKAREEETAGPLPEADPPTED